MSQWGIPRNFERDGCVVTLAPRVGTDAFDSIGPGSKIDALVLMGIQSLPGYVRNVPKAQKIWKEMSDKYVNQLYIMWKDDPTKI